MDCYFKLFEGVRYKYHEDVVTDREASPKALWFPQCPSWTKRYKKR